MESFENDEVSQGVLYEFQSPAPFARHTTREASIPYVIRPSRKHAPELGGGETRPRINNIQNVVAKEQRLTII